jgi:hypothetical protein
MAASVYSRTLQKAAELLGGRKQLCRHLRVPSSDLQDWIEEKAIPPIPIFLRAVDLILDETGPAESEPGDPPAPREGAAGGFSTSYL